MREKTRERRRGGEAREGGKSYPNGRNYSKQGNRIKEGEVTTFYFTNFPEYLTVEDLWEKFARIWRVDEVFIPLKLDRKGKRFGFVRFWEIQNVEMLLRKIEDIWFDTYKLRANLALHQRGEQHPSRGKQPTTNTAVGKGVGGEVRHGVTFKQSVVKDVPLPQIADNGRTERRIPVPKRRLTEAQILEGTMEVDVIEENMTKFQKCWV
ncbi:RNA-binding protein 25-like, partial [Trifolium medium]|nr:RNA-binding protein 25-like [Trifolium medium]